MALKELTRKQLSAFLVAYYGAIALEEARAVSGADDADTQDRYDHLRHIMLLLDTLPHVSKKTIARLSLLAATTKSSVVKKLFAEMLAEGASAHYTGDRMWTAPEFFDALLEKIDSDRKTAVSGQDVFANLMKWFSFSDPRCVG